MHLTMQVPKEIFYEINAKRGYGGCPILETFDLRRAGENKEEKEGRGVRIFRDVALAFGSEAASKLGLLFNWQPEDYQQQYWYGVLGNMPGYVKVCLDLKADPESTTGGGLKAIHIASAKNHRELTNVLVRYGQVDAKDAKGCTALHMAISTNNVPQVTLLLENKASLQLPDPTGRTPLELSVAQIQGQKAGLEIAEKLLKNNANVEVKNSQGFPLLLQVLDPPCLPLLRLLIQYRANVNAQGPNGEMAIFEAFRHEDAHLAALLDLILSAGGNLEARDSKGFTPLLKAAYAGKSQAATMLLKYGANKYAVDANRNTALHLAATCGNKEVVSLFLKYDFSLSAQNALGFTPIQLAVECKHQEIAKEIEQEVHRREVILISNGNDEMVRIRKEEYLLKQARLNFFEKLWWDKDNKARIFSEAIENADVNELKRYGQDYLTNLRGDESKIDEINIVKGNEEIGKKGPRVQAELHKLLKLISVTYYNARFHESDFENPAFAFRLRYYMLGEIRKLFIENLVKDFKEIKDENKPKIVENAINLAWSASGITRKRGISGAFSCEETIRLRCVPMVNELCEEIKNEAKNNEADLQATVIQSITAKRNALKMPAQLSCCDEKVEEEKDAEQIAKGIKYRITYDKTTAVRAKPEVEKPGEVYPDLSRFVINFEGKRCRLIHAALKLYFKTTREEKAACQRLGVATLNNSRIESRLNVVLYLLKCGCSVFDKNIVPYLAVERTVSAPAAVDSKEAKQPQVDQSNYRLDESIPLVTALEFAGVLENGRIVEGVFNRAKADYQLLMGVLDRLFSVLPSVAVVKREIGNSLLDMIDPSWWRRLRNFRSWNGFLRDKPQLILKAILILNRKTEDITDVGLENEIDELAASCSPEASYFIDGLRTASANLRALTQKRQLVRFRTDPAEIVKQENASIQAIMLAEKTYWCKKTEEEIKKEREGNRQKDEEIGRLKALLISSGIPLPPSPANSTSTSSVTASAGGPLTASSSATVASSMLSATGLFSASHASSSSGMPVTISASSAVSSSSAEVAMSVSAMPSSSSVSALSSSSTTPSVSCILGLYAGID